MANASVSTPNPGLKTVNPNIDVSGNITTPTTTSNNNNDDDNNDNDHTAYT